MNEFKQNFDLGPSLFPLCRLLEVWAKGKKKAKHLKHTQTGAPTPSSLATTLSILESANAGLWIINATSFSLIVSGLWWNIEPQRYNCFNTGLSN